MRTMINENPFPPVAMPGFQQPAPGFGCRWIWHPDTAPGEPAVMAFRLAVHLEQAHTVRLHVTADQRYELFLDGARLGRGPMRGDLTHWCFESYEVELEPGDHLLAARVWWLPDDGPPMAQISADPGFLLLAEGPLSDVLSTGAGDWQVSQINSYQREPGSLGGYHVVGWSFRLDGHDYPWGWHKDPNSPGTSVPALSVAVPVGQGSHPSFHAETPQRRPHHHLEPARIPAMLENERQTGQIRYARHEESPDAWQSDPVDLAQHDTALASGWQQLLSGESPLTLPPGARQRILIDLEDYYCAYPELVTSGGDGTEIRLGWAESLFVSDNSRDMHKGHRDQVDGKYFRGLADTFVLEGGPQRLYDTLWWRSGRYIQLLIAVGDEPLTIEKLAWRETHYPLEMSGSLHTGDAPFDDAVPIMFRTLQMCAHETYMDCPYYEQLMYVGDTRLEVLVTYLTSPDDRLPARACELFDQSRSPDGLTKSRYPSAVPQVIPPFSLWWVAMVHDHFMWRDRHDRVRRWLPGVDAVLSAFGTRLNSEGLVQAVPGWNFVDWVPEWNAGWPPDARHGASALINLQYLYALDCAVDLYEHLDQPDRARHWARQAERLRDAIADGFWNDQRGLVADDRQHSRYSEHAQCLALLTDLLQSDEKQRMIEGLLTAPDLARATVYFSHYLLEALYKVDAMEPFFERLAFWKEMPGKGFRTTLEAPEPSRSDCHAWGSHPIYHAYASILGARPAEPGFRRIRIAPHPGPLARLRGSFPHAWGGMVHFDLSVQQGSLSGEITLPADLHGELVWQNNTTALTPGVNRL